MFWEVVILRNYVYICYGETSLTIEDRLHRLTIAGLFIYFQDNCWYELLGTSVRGAVSQLVITRGCYAPDVPFYYTFVRSVMKTGFSGIKMLTQEQTGHVQIGKLLGLRIIQYQLYILLVNNPAPWDLSYPERLEMIKTVAERINVEDFKQRGHSRQNSIKAIPAWTALPLWRWETSQASTEATVLLTSIACCNVVSDSFCRCLVRS